MMIAADLTNASGAATASGTWLLVGIGVLAFLAIIVRNVLGAIADGKKLWGRNPPIDDDVKALRKQLEGLAPSEKVDALVEKFGHAATKTEIEQIRSELKGFVDQAQMDRRMSEVSTQIGRVERDLCAQMKELRIYVHEEIHGFRNQAQAIWANAEHQREGLHSRINIIAEAVSEMRGWMRAREEQA